MATLDSAYKAIRRAWQAVLHKINLSSANFTLTSELLGSGTADATTFLRGDRTWSVPGAAGGSATIHTALIDFGSALHQTEALFTVTDAMVTTSHKIIASLSRDVTGTGKDTDETEMDAFVFSAIAGTGQFDLWAKSLEGAVAGAFRVNYALST